jgi:hypothetical protein
MRTLAVAVVLFAIVAGCTAKPDPTAPTPRSDGTTIGVTLALNQSEIPPAALRTNVTIETLLFRAPLGAALHEPVRGPDDNASWRALLDDYEARVAQNASASGTPLHDFPELRAAIVDDFLRNASLPEGRIVVSWSSRSVEGFRCNCSDRFEKRAQTVAEVQPMVLNATSGVSIDPILDPAFPTGSGTRHVVLLRAPDDLWTIYDHDPAEAEAHDRELYGMARNATLNRTVELLPHVVLSPFEDVVDAFEAAGLTQRDVDVLRAIPEVRAVRAL